MWYVKMWRGRAKSVHHVLALGWGWEARVGIAILLAAIPAKCSFLKQSWTEA